LIKNRREKGSTRAEKGEYERKAGDLKSDAHPKGEVGKKRGKTEPAGV